MTRAITQHAKQLCELGIEIAKLKPHSKEPAGGAGWQDRVAKNPSTIDRWRGEFNIAAMGGSHGPDGKRLLILDIDVKNGALGQESFERLRADFDKLPKTAEALTPSGGRHYYLWAPETAPTRGIARSLGKSGYRGIDLIGDGLFAAAAPSVLAAGQYQWCRKPWDGIADAPDWLVALLGRSTALECNGTQTNIPGHAPAHAALLDEVVRRYQVLQPGQRNDRMHRAVASLFAKGLDPATVTQVMLDWHQHYAATIGTELPQAIYLLTACIKSCNSSIEQGKFIIGGSADHLQDCCNLQLPPAALHFLSALSLGVSSVSPVSLINKGDNTQPQTPVPKAKATSFQRIGREELQMAEALIRHCLYEQNRHPERQEIQMTDRQLKGIMTQKFGTKFDDNGNGNSIKLRRLKYKFVTTEKGKAGKVELLVRTKSGHTSVPSEYKATGIAPALSHDLRRQA
jgi:hypothetical protein